MPDILYYSALLGGFVTVALLPILCLMDVKTRRVTDWVWFAYIITALPAMTLLYLNGLPVEQLIISVLIGLMLLLLPWYCITFATFDERLYGGADAKFLFLFCSLVPLNPMNILEHVTTFKISFIFVLGIVLLLHTLFFKNRRDVPMMIPISVSVLLTMIIGVFL